MRRFNDMVTIIGAVIFIAPMLLVLNEGENIAMNVLGFLYIICVFVITKFTKSGRMFVKDFYRSTLRIFNWKDYEKKKS